MGRSTKSTENTLVSKSLESNKARETTITKMLTTEETNMMEEAMVAAGALAREYSSEAAVHKAEKIKKIRAKEETKIRAQEEAKLKEEMKARVEEKNLAKTNAKLKSQIRANETSQANSTANSTSNEFMTSKMKMKEFDAKLDAAVKKRLAALPACRGGDGNGTGIMAGTNVFDGKINATDAVGKVGFTNYSVVKPPYKVKRCDQILLLPGKKLNPKDYCEKEDAFMTMSIYMMNFFLKRDPNKLVESFNMYEITQIPS